MKDNKYRSLANTVRIMQNEADKSKELKIGTGTPTDVSKTDHHKKVEKQLYRIDESQFILLKKAGLTKRIRNNPDEIARAKEQGWVVAGAVAEDIDQVDENSNEEKLKSAQAILAKARGDGPKEKREHETFFAKDKEGVEHQHLKYTDIHGKKGHISRPVSSKSNSAWKPVKEDKELSQENINELSKETLKSYVKKAATQGDRALARGEKEEDKAMSTDGTKHPEKSKKHNDAAGKEFGTFAKRDHGTSLANAKLGKKGDPGKITGHSQATAKVKASKNITKEDLLQMSIGDAKAILESVKAKRQTFVTEDDGREHIIVGLRKAISLKGNHNVHFGDGSKHMISADHAATALQRHDSHAKPSEKLAFAQKISASHTAFHSALKEKPKTSEPAKKEPDKKPVSVAKKATIHLNVEDSEKKTKAGKYIGYEPDRSKITLPKVNIKKDSSKYDEQSKKKI